MRAVWYPIELAVWLVSMLVVSTITDNGPVAVLMIVLRIPGSVLVARNLKNTQKNGLATIVPHMRSERRRSPSRHVRVYYWSDTRPVRHLYQFADRSRKVARATAVCLVLHARVGSEALRSRSERLRGFSADTMFGRLCSELGAG